MLAGNVPNHFYAHQRGGTGPDAQGVAVANPGDFRGLPQQVLATELDEFGKLEYGKRILHRFRLGDYRVYFERHKLGVLVHRILNRHTLKDFLFRSGLPGGEDKALQENPKFWELIEAAKGQAKG